MRLFASLVAFGLLCATFMFILLGLCPTSEQNCIQEVKQGRTLSRELGKLRRDEKTGLLVCSRAVAP